MPGIPAAGGGQEAPQGSGSAGLSWLGWKLSESSRAQTAGEYLAAFVIPALGCLQLCLGAVLSPLPALPLPARPCPPERTGSSPPSSLPSLHRPSKRAGEERPCPPAATAEHLQGSLRQPCCIPGESLILTRHSPRPPPADPPCSVPPELPLTPLTAPEPSAPGCSLSWCLSLLPSPRAGQRCRDVALDSP